MSQETGQSTDVAIPQTFEENLKDHIRKGIGDMMSDEDLRKLIEKGIHETFFKPRYEERGYRNTVEKPPLMAEILQEALMPAIQKAAEHWVVYHSDQVKEAIDNLFAEGAGIALIKAMNRIFRDDVMEFQNNTYARLTELEKKNNIY